MIHCKSSSTSRLEELAGTGVKFERIRRITGYLVGTTDRFNNGKRAEEHDRVKHCTMETWR
ncbi:anaerobic ribonucleoside-triphosphate reductase [Mailhella massiliensis]|uniref:anaerobic ribonucleoside-triphosphate reductase n=1 Tax=Mailhella massiliensis TaxID=1903261 RepID=UPI00235318E3|nr:anaerobic ribonucleoside-triphosphate reductase [Mailhella massiliensis]